MILYVVKFANYIICAIFNVILIFNIGNKEDLKEHTFKRYLIAIIFSSVFIVIANIISAPIIKLAILFITQFVLVEYMFKKNTAKNLLICILAFIIFTVSNIISSLTFVSIFRFDIFEIMNHAYYYTMFNLLDITCLVCFIFIIKMKPIFIMINRSMSKKTKVLLVIIIVLQLLRMGCELFISYYVTQIPQLQYISIISYICSILSIGFLIYCASIIIDKENIIKLSNEYSENLQIYNNVLQESIENQRKISHEHGNQLTVLSGYISTNDVEKAKKYLGKIIGQPCQVDNGTLSNIKDSGLKALIVFKVAVIENKNIELELVIEEDIDDVIIANDDMCNIIGVLLDNAIDASIETDEPFISLSITKNEIGLIINIMNSVKDSNIDTDIIYRKGYSTKGDGRGFGLYIVEEIIEKYEEIVLHTKSEDNLFTQELIIANKIISSIIR